MFTGIQWIAVIAIMLGAYHCGYAIGRRAESGRAIYYRGKWIEASQEWRK